MNPRSTGVLFVLAAALAAFVYFYEIAGEQGRKDAEEATKRLFAGIEPESIETITLYTTDALRVDIRRVDNRWRIAAPLDFPADAFAIDGIASALASIQSETVIEDPRPPEVYGLGLGETDETDKTTENEKYLVRFTAGGVESVLSVGNDTPVGSNTYAAVRGTDTVYIVASHRIGAFKKSFEDLREKRISRFDRSAVRKIRLSWPDGEGEAGVEIEPADEGWRLVEPIQGPADEMAVEDLLSSLSALRADGFIDEPGTDAEMGLDRPVFEASIELAAEEGGEEQVVVVTMGGLSVDGASRIVRGAASSLYTIPLAQTADFPTRLAPYRFRQLAKFDSADAKRVEFGFLTQAGETIAISAAKGDDGWTATPDEFEADKLATLVTELSRLRAESTLADELGPDELAAIGLEPPQASITVYGEDDTAPLAEVRLGTSRAEGIPAQIPGNSTVFRLAPAVGENLPLNHEALKNHFLAKAAVDAPPF
ncbi:MAG: DUF4340 domain-containing protein [Myxococcota bacterium]